MQPDFDLARRERGQLQLTHHVGRIDVVHPGYRLPRGGLDDIGKHHPVVLEPLIGLQLVVGVQLDQGLVAFPLAHIDQVIEQPLRRVLNPVGALQIGAGEGQATAAHGRRTTGLPGFFQHDHLQARLGCTQGRAKTRQPATDDQQVAFVMIHGCAPPCRNGVKP
ncbi:hypothetical protein D3C85_1467170 [compost metagenome]